MKLDAKQVFTEALRPGAVTGAFLNKKLARVFMRFLSCFPPRFVLASILIVGFVVHHDCGFFLVFSPIFKK